jgi:hypothetical protein
VERLVAAKPVKAAGTRSKQALTKRKRVAAPSRGTARKNKDQEASAPAESTTKKPDKGGKVIRDRFSMPAREYARIAELKKRCLAAGVAVKKSELLRAGLAAIHELPDDRLAQAIAAVVSSRTARGSGKKRAEAV